MEEWPDDAQLTYVHSQINLYVHSYVVTGDTVWK